MRPGAAAPIAPRLRRPWLRVLGAVLLLGAATLVAVYFTRPEWLLEAEMSRLARAADLRQRSVMAAAHDWKFYDGGRGEVVVLVHGFSGSKENWLPTARYLTDTHRVIIPDLPGWGETTREAGADYTTVPQVERLASFLDELGVRHATIVGHSMGGQIAGVFAARYPERIDTLVLVASAGVHFEENDFARAVRGGATPFNFDDRAGFDAFMRELFVDPPWLPGRLKDVLIARNRASHGFHAALLRSFSDDDGAFLLERQLDRITAPVAVIWCDQDRILDPSSVATFEAGQPHARVRVLEGCGHMPMMEAPRALADAIVGRE